jgi:hypothetical protein
MKTLFSTSLVLTGNLGRHYELYVQINQNFHLLLPAPMKSGIRDSHRE